MGAVGLSHVVSVCLPSSDVCVRVLRDWLPSSAVFSHTEVEVRMNWCLLRPGLPAEVVTHVNIGTRR